MSTWPAHVVLHIRDDTAAVAAAARRRDDVMPDTHRISASTQRPPAHSPLATIATSQLLDVSSNARLLARTPACVLHVLRNHDTAPQPAVGRARPATQPASVNHGSVSSHNATPTNTTHVKHQTPHLHLAPPPLGVTPVEFRGDLWHQKTRVLGYRAALFT